VVAAAVVVLAVPAATVDQLVLRQQVVQVVLDY
jgi:hypothetical protein